MSENPHVNMDARDLWDLAAQAQEVEANEWTGVRLVHISGEQLAMLLRAAQHLQSMDEKIARHIDGDFTGGLAYAQKAAIARSNVLPGPGRKVTNEEGETLIAAFAQAGGKPKRLPAGATTPPKPTVVEVDVKKSAPARTGFKLGDL